MQITVLGGLVLTFEGLNLYLKNLTQRVYLWVRGPGFLAVVWFGSCAPSLPLSRQLDRRQTRRLAKRDTHLAEGRRGRKGWGRSPNHMKVRKPGPLVIQYWSYLTQYHSWWVQLSRPRLLRCLLAVDSLPRRQRWCDLHQQIRHSKTSLYYVRLITLITYVQCLIESFRI